MSINSFKLTLTSATDLFTFMGETSSVIIGRSNKCEFVVPKDDLSREHCRFEYLNGETFITDLGSKNGVSIDGKRLAPNVKTKFTDTSDVLLSEVYLFKFFSVAIEVKSKSDQFMEDKKMRVIHGAQTRTVTLELEEARRKKNRASKDGHISSDRFRWIKMASGLIVVLGYLLYKFATE